MLSKISLNLECDKFYLKIWVIYFIVTLFIIFLVQLILLPFVFSSWHAGNGLLVGGDWIGFHREALELAGRINDQGWSAWELWPKGWFPAGVAAALYALIWPAPWVLAPLNAAVHAFSGLIVLNILNIFTRRKEIDLVAVIPFLFFPSAMILYTQIHRDGYNILGMLLFIYGLLLIVRLDDLQVKIKNIEIKGLILTSIGIVLLWLSRPHTLIIFLYSGALLFLCVTMLFAFMILKKSLRWQNALFRMLIFTVVLSLMIPLTKSEGAGKYLREYGSCSYIDEGNIVLEEDFRWTRTPFLPSRIDNHLYTIAVTRSVLYPTLYGTAAVNIDSDVVFSRALDFVYYLPRALQIAFLAPFPKDWFGEGSLQTTTFLRRISALEMIFIYFFILPMVFSIWIWRKKIEIYILFIFCTVMMLPIIYSTPNLGTIYRYRYGYLMLLISLGVAVSYQFIKGKIASKSAAV